MPNSGMAVLVTTCIEDFGLLRSFHIKFHENIQQCNGNLLSGYENGLWSQSHLPGYITSLRIVSLICKIGFPLLVSCCCEYSVRQYIRCFLEHIASPL